jgi:multiple sugar transport system substrate-binding protein
MKKFVLILLALAMTVSVTACTAAPTASTATSSGAPASTAAAPADGASGAAPSSAAPASGNAAPVSITFYTYNYRAAQKDAVDQLIQEFEQANPNVTVEVVYNGDDQNGKIQADIAAGVTPDLIQTSFDSLEYAVHNYGVQDLNSIADPAELAEHLKGFYPAALEVAKVDGKLYGLPYTFSTPVLFYNAALFKEAGLDPNDPPTTWDEVKEYAQAIADKTDAEGFSLGGMATSDWLIQGLFKSNGGGVMSANKKTITFGEQPAIDVVSMLQDIRKSGAYADVTDMQTLETFPQGKLGMLLSTSTVQASFQAAAKAAGWELRAAKMPTFGDKPAVPVNSGSGLLICSKDPAKQQAAWKFMEFLTSDRGYTIITTKMGYPPLRPNTLQDDKYLKQWAEENPLVQPNLEQLQTVTPWLSYPGDNWSQIETNILVDAFNKCLFSDVDVAQTMKDAQARAQELMP